MYTCTYMLLLPPPCSHSHVLVESFYRNGINCVLFGDPYFSYLLMCLSLLCILCLNKLKPSNENKGDRIVCCSKPAVAYTHRYSHV